MIKAHIFLLIVVSQLAALIALSKESTAQIVDTSLLPSAPYFPSEADCVALRDKLNQALVASGEQLGICQRAASHRRCIEEKRGCFSEVALHSCGGQHLIFEECASLASAYLCVRQKANIEPRICFQRARDRQQFESSLEGIRGSDAGNRDPVSTLEMIEDIGQSLASLKLNSLSRKLTKTALDMATDAAQNGVVELEAAFQEFDHAGSGLVSASAGASIYNHIARLGADAQTRQQNAKQRIQELLAEDAMLQEVEDGDSGPHGEDEASDPSSQVEWPFEPPSTTTCAIVRGNIEEMRRRVREGSPYDRFLLNSICWPPDTNNSLRTFDIYRCESALYRSIGPDEWYGNAMNGMTHPDRPGLTIPEWDTLYSQYCKDFQ